MACVAQSPAWVCCQASAFVTFPLSSVSQADFFQVVVKIAISIPHLSVYQPNNPGVRCLFPEYCNKGPLEIPPYRSFNQCLPGSQSLWPGGSCSLNGQAWVMYLPLEHLQRMPGRQRRGTGKERIGELQRIQVIIARACGERLV